MRWIVGGRAVTNEAPSTSQMGRFETKVMAQGVLLVRHARSIAFQMAEPAVPRDLFRRILEMICELIPRPVAQCRP